MRENNTTYIASCLFGKDSLATILLALEHGEPLDRVVFAEVMFDNANNISGEIPEHIEWVYSTGIPKLNKMGMSVDVVKSDKDYLWFFNEIRHCGKYKGLKGGFPIGKKCVINRECKIKPIYDYYYKQFDGKIVQYIGIAADEKKRLCRLKNEKRNFEKVSLLAKYGVTEAMAMQMCRAEGLLSPIYDENTRNGCWFCPNTRIGMMRLFRKSHPDLWNRLVELGRTPDLCSYGFKYGVTIDEINYRFEKEELQMELF